MSLRSRWLLLPVLAAVGAAGCRHDCCKRGGACPPPPAAGVYSPGAPILGPPIGATPGAPGPSSQILLPSNPPGVAAPAPAPDAFAVPPAPATSGFTPNLSQSAYLGG